MTIQRLVLGTSAYGSGVPSPLAIKLATQAYEKGVRFFDTAPTYGAGYSEIILGKMGKQTEIEFSTKYGQLNEPFCRGLAKRIRRYSGINDFRLSYQNLLSTDRRSKTFWSSEAVNRSFEHSNTKLRGARIGSLFLHSPPINILGSDIEKNIFELKSIFPELKLGLANPTAEDLKKMSSGYKSETFDMIQVGLDRMVTTLGWNVDFGPYQLWLNQLFQYAKVNCSDDLDAFFGKMKETIFSHGGSKAVVGCNSIKSVEGLQELSSKLFSLQ